MQRSRANRCQTDTIAIAGWSKDAATKRARKRAQDRSNRLSQGGSSRPGGALGCAMRSFQARRRPVGGAGNCCERCDASWMSEEWGRRQPPVQPCRERAVWTVSAHSPTASITAAAKRASAGVPAVVPAEGSARYTSIPI